MSSATTRPSGTVPRVALKVPVEAAESLGMSHDHFDRYVRPELRTFKAGRNTYVSLKELERWTEANSARELRSGRA